MKKFVLESVKKIQDAIGNNKLVIFVGSGVSANSGLPVWNELINKFALSVGKKSPYSVDDYLKIPQYYYNERGFKEYYEVITTTFDVIARPNSLHQLLFQLNPAHIITTNFDNLLEQSIIESGYSYDVVRQDADLPYTPNNKIIIKMHGDLGLKNIVLKEDDYLSYSSNFRLVENFVKSLFASYTVLFVGYSVNDPDVKLLFQWVKDILKEDFQNAYLLNTDTHFGDIDRVEFNYYHHRGINILHFASVVSEVEDVSINSIELNSLGEKGRTLYKFLNLIQRYNREIEKTAIQTIYSKLITFDVLNRVLAKDVLEILGEEGSYQIEDCSLLIKSQLIERLHLELEEIKYDLEKLCKSDQAKLNKIKEILAKANIKVIELFESRKRFEIPKSQFIEVDDAITMYNYRTLKKMYLVESESDDIDLFRNAFYLYKIGQYLSSYKILKKISAKSYRDKKYLFYFLSEFNRNHVGKLILYHRQDISQEEFNTIRLEVNNLDLEETYSAMPTKVRKEYIFLKDLLNFKLIYQYIDDAIRIQIEVENEKNVNRWASQNTGPIYRLNAKALELWEYINCNYLTIEHFREVKSFYQSYIKSVIISYTTEERRTDKNSQVPFLSNAKVNKLEELSYCTLFIMINAMKSDEIEKLLCSYNVVKIKVQLDDIKKLQSAFANIASAIKELNPPFEYCNGISKMLILFARIDIGVDGFSYILQEMKSLLIAKGLKYDNYRYLAEFIAYQTNNYLPNVVVQDVIDFIEEYLKQVLLRRFSGWDYEATNTLRIMNKFANVFNIKGVNGNLSDTLTNLLLDSISSLENSSEKNNLLRKLIIPLYKIIQESKRNKVQNVIYSQLKQNFCPHLYYEACMKKIIVTDLELEDRLIKEIDSLLELNGEERKKGEISSPDPEDTFITYLTNLIFSNNYKDKNKYYKFVGRKPIFDFIFSPTTFDYEIFDLDWLLRLPSELILKLVNKPNTRNILEGKLKDMIIEGNVSKELKEIYFNYFTSFKRHNRRKITVNNVRISKCIHRKSIDFS